MVLISALHAAKRSQYNNNAGYVGIRFHGKYKSDLIHFDTDTTDNCEWELITELIRDNQVTQRIQNCP